MTLKGKCVIPNLQMNPQVNMLIFQFSYIILESLPVAHTESISIPLCVLLTLERLVMAKGADMFKHITGYSI